MSLLPPAFKDPAFAPLGPPIKRSATFAQMRGAYTEAQRHNALEDFESENHGNADTGCLQEPCMPPTGKEVLRHGEIGQISGRINFVTSPAINFDQAREMLDADVAHMRENRQITVSALLRAGQKLDANLAPPSPELTSALNAAQAALAEHLFGEAKKVKDPFEKAAMKLRAKDVERAVQMKAKADVMLQAACGAGQTATGMMLLQEAAKPTQPKPKSLREACCDKMFDLAKKDKPLVKNILALFAARTLADVEDKYLPDLWDQLICPF